MEMGGFDSRPRLQGVVAGGNLPAIIVPAGVDCDGQWPLTRFFCFTDRALDSPARGASFDVELPIGISETEALERISESLANLRRKFLITEVPA